MERFGYQRLLVWQVGMTLAESVYQVTREFPREETFGLVAQLRRAAVSVPANLAEGYGRGSKASMAHYARIARGSLFELRTELELAVRVGLIPAAIMAPLQEQSEELSRMIEGFIRSQS